MPNLLIANTVTDLMIDRFDPAHSMGLFVSSTRKLLIAQRSDLVVFPYEPSEAFRQHVLEVREEELANYCVWTPSSPASPMLDESNLHNAPTQEILAFLAESPNCMLASYALDRNIMSACREFHLLPSGYRKLPDVSLVSALYKLNTKSGFRAVAKNLGLRLPNGDCGHGPVQLLKIVDKFLGEHGRVIIKSDRASNGFGQLVVTAEQSKEEVTGLLIDFNMAFLQTNDSFVVEEYIPHASSPSAEFLVDEGGVRFLYFCDQLSNHFGFSGMRWSECCLTKPVQTQLLQNGAAFGEYLFRIGYRGNYDVDAVCSAAEDIYLTEINVRRTAGSYVNDFLSSLRNSSTPFGELSWATGTAHTKEQTFADIAQKLKTKGLLFTRASGKGVILVSDNLLGRQPYLVVASGDLELSEMIRKAVPLLNA